MRIYAHTEAGVTAVLIAVVLVGLFVWIFNSWRLGRFNRFLKPKEPVDKPAAGQRKRCRVWLACGVIAAVLIVVLGILATNPIVSCRIEIPEEVLAAVEAQSEGVYSEKLPLIPVYTSVDSYTDGVVYYTIHYFPFGTVKMSYTAGEGYNMEKALTGL